MQLSFSVSGLLLISVLIKLYCHLNHHIYWRPLFCTCSEANFYSWNYNFDVSCALDVWKLHTLTLNLLFAIAGITDWSVIWLLIFVQAFCWFVFWGLSLFLGNPLHRANCSFVVARLSWCGIKQKLLMKLLSRKMVKGGSSMNSKNWSVSSVPMSRRIWVCGSPFGPSAGESLIIQSLRRVVACSGIVPLLSGKRCKPGVGGVVRHQCVEL